MKTMLFVGLLAFSGLVTGSSVTLSAQTQAATTKVCTLKVSGMTCAGCTTAVKLAAKKVDGVKAANVNYTTGLATVTYDPAKTTPDAVAKVVTAESGFRAVVQAAK